MNLTRRINVIVDLDTIKRMKDIGHKLDVNNDGLYDARMGAINVWCSPTDRPSCWPEDIIQGCLEYPRDFVGTIGWEWTKDRKAELYIDISPYELIRRKEEITPEEWQILMLWLEGKARDLIRMAQET